TLVNSISFQVLGSNRATGKHCMRGGSYALVYNGTRTYPHAIFQCYRTGYQVERVFFIIMATGKQHSSLRNTNIGAYSDLYNIIYPHILTYPYVIANLKQPWIFDVDAWFYFYP